MVAEDDEMLKDKEIDKLMALISLSFNKIYKPTNNNLRTSSNTNRANQDNSLRINRGAGEQIEQNDDNYDLANEHELLASLIEKLKCEIDDNKKYKEIDKLMALISLSFKKIYKPTNNNLQTSSNTSRANQDNSPRINRNAGYENQRNGTVAGARENVGSLVRDDTDDESEDQELEAHYMYMAQIQEVSPDAADSGPIFDSEPLQKVSNDDHYNVFAIESEHPEQSKSVHDTYPIQQDEHNVIINSLDMIYDREQIE
nr:hypothetical protein [Tanacetum cinerariifolium]